MIPKIIHQTYKNDDLPDLYKTCQKKIQSLHPDFTYMFYTDDSMYEFMKTEFPEYYDKFNNLQRTIMKVDMFRYFLMYKHGGLYADMDYFMLKSFNMLNYSIVIPCSRETEEGETKCLGNCFFASVPNHPFWKSLMDTLFTMDRSGLDFTKDDNIDQNPLGTGPHFLYSMWNVYDNKNEIHVPRKPLFHPATKNDRRYIKELEKTPCYGIHLCTGLWRNPA